MYQSPQPRSGFARGLIVGIGLVFALTFFINRTTLADWLVAPLLTEDTGGNADVIVVLGAGLIGECVPNLNAVRRVLLAARLWREQRAPQLLFTGGTDGSCAVGTAMALLARELGVPESNLRVEAWSTNTRENAEISAPMLRGWGMRRVLLVTDRLHMTRASGVFARLGFEVLGAAVPISEGHEDNVSMLRAGLREYAALAYYRLRGWTGAPDGADVAMTGVGKRVGRRSSTTVGPIVGLGASYLQDWPIDHVGQVAVVNRGAAGEKSFQLLERFERDVVPLQPRGVILWGFINDLHSAPSGQMEATVAKVRDNYTRMIALARQHGIEPVLATEVTIRPPAGSLLTTLAEWGAGVLLRKESYQDRINQQVIATNQWLIGEAAREGLLVLQFQSVLSEPAGQRRKLFAQQDGSHITAAGYEALTMYATPLLEEFFVVR